MSYAGPHLDSEGANRVGSVLIVYFLGRRTRLVLLALGYVLRDLKKKDFLVS